MCRCFWIHLCLLCVRYVGNGSINSTYLVVVLLVLVRISRFVVVVVVAVVVVVSLLDHFPENPG